MTGGLIYLVRPSDSGKDSLLQVTHKPLALRGYRIMRRVITRSTEAVGEDAQAVTPAQFDTLEWASVSATNWHTDDLYYGISVQVNEWLTQNYDVLVDDSRGYLAQARRCYPDLLAVLLGVKPEMLHQRLLTRDRGSLEKIKVRLTRNAGFAVDLKNPLFQLNNSGDLDDTLRSLLAHLDSNRACV